MKINPLMLEDLRKAIDATGGLTANATMRQRWDALWRSKFDVRRFYKAGMNDDHIDTALRRVAQNKIWV